jgi:hypothetical protein
LSVARPLVSIPIGVLVERTKSSGTWAEFYWHPVGVLAGVPDTPPWTELSNDGERAVFYAGVVQIELYRTETSYYRDNLASASPQLWIALEPTQADPPFRVSIATADPAEGESLTQSVTSVVDCVPMPGVIGERIAAFVAEHHIEHSFVKRERDRADPEALARRPPHKGKSNERA